MNQRKLGSIISYVQMFLGVIVSLIYTPFMIQKLGQSEYGLYNTVASTISMLSVLSLGFNSSYIRYYSRYKKNEDKESIYRLNGLFIIIFIIIGIIALLCGIFLLFNIEMIFSDGLTASEYDLARKLFFLLILNLAISFPMSVFSDIISAHERFVFLKSLGVIRTVFSPFLSIPLLLMGYRSIAIVVVTVLLSLLTDIMYFIYVVFVLKEKFWFSGFEKGLFKDIFVFTSFIGINIIVDQINWNIDKIVLARFKGTVAVAIYSVGYTLNTYFNMISTSISGVFTPLVHRITNSNLGWISKKRELTALFIKVGRVQFLILGLVASGLVVFGKQFIYFWAGEGYEDAYYVALLLILPSIIPLIQNVGIEIQRAQNKHKFRSVVYSIMAIINLVMSIYLCQIWGAVGSALGTGISLILANGIIINIYYHKACNVNVIIFWKNIISMIPGVIIPFIIGAILMNYVVVNSLFHLGIYIIGYSILYAICIWMFSMNSYEKKLLLRGKNSKKLC